MLIAFSKIRLVIRENDREGEAEKAYESMKDSYAFNYLLAIAAKAFSAA